MSQRMLPLKSKVTINYENELDRYSQRLSALSSIASGRFDKGVFLYHACHNGRIVQDHFDQEIKKIEKLESESDFSITPLMRLLYLEPGHYNEPQIKMSIAKVKQRISSALYKFPFLPKRNTNLNMDNLVFWSENHLLMTLSSAYLYHQYVYNQQELNAQSFSASTLFSVNDQIESKLLKKYLQIHLDESFNGMYEVNSHVYLPYSLNALFNLFDLAEDSEISSMAERLIDRIVYQLMLCTDPHLGIANLSASARAYDRTRLRNWGHNINSFVYLMVGRNAEGLKTSTLGDFLLVTKWRPKAEAFEALHGDGFTEKMRFSHKLDDLEILYHQSIFPPDITRNYSKELEEPLRDFDEVYTPLYWSAGLIVHPYLASRTRRYQRTFHLTSNRHLWPCNFFFYSDTNFLSSMESYDQFSTGQAYTDIALNVYKQSAHGLVMSSFSLYNVHVCGYQQLPWMVNVAGLPVWSQSASSTDSIASFGITNTHNPAVQQTEDLLLVTYLTPTMFTNPYHFLVRSLFTTKVRMFYPVHLVDRVVVIPGNCPYFGADVWQAEKEAQLTERDSALTIGPQVFVPDTGNSTGNGTGMTTGNGNGMTTTGRIRSGYDSTGAALDNDDQDLDMDMDGRPHRGSSGREHIQPPSTTTTSSSSTCLSVNPLATIYSGMSTIFTGKRPATTTTTSSTAKGVPSSSSGHTTTSHTTSHSTSHTTTQQSSADHTKPPPHTTSHTNTSTSHSSSSSSSRKQRFVGEYYFQANGQHPNAHMWIVCAYQTCYIALCCTKSSYLDESDAPDCRWRASEQETSYDVLSRLVCDAQEQSWVIVTGTKDDYPTLEKFINLRVYQISIVERVDRGNNGKVYEVLVKDDARHLQLSYGYDIRRRKQVDVTLLAPSAPPSLPSVPITKTFNTSYFA